MQADKPLHKLRTIDREIQLLTHTAALLQWDQETGMPPKAIMERSEQIALIEGLVHDRMTAPEVGDMLREAGFSSSGGIQIDGDDDKQIDRGFLRAFGRVYERAVKTPRRLVTEMARTVSQAQAAWVEARKRDDFSHFEPHLTRIIALVSEKAEAIGYPEQPYDALLDEFEPGMLTSQVKPVFETLRLQLTKLVEKIVSLQTADDAFRYRTYPEELQKQFSLRVLREMGYDFERGRLDESAHPFTTSLGRDDIRVTTHYQEEDLLSALFSTIHEGGHALYEMGIDPKYHDSSLGEGTSLGVHESQSRTWENLIGRHPRFWRYYFPILKKEYFPDQLTDVDELSFIRGINKVEPSLIRIYADEVTYSLHIILRFELELALISGDLQVGDLPGVWNEMMQKLLKCTPPTNAKGVLQDVHWSMGAIGYFPTYALGNLYGAQFLNTIRTQMPDMDDRLARGELGAIREWQHEHIHRHGSLFTAPELCRRITGEELKPDHFITYLEEKFRVLYDV